MPSARSRAGSTTSTRAFVDVDDPGQARQQVADGAFDVGHALMVSPGRRGPRTPARRPQKGFITIRKTITAIMIARNMPPRRALARGLQQLGRRAHRTRRRRRRAAAAAAGGVVISMSRCAERDLDEHARSRARSGRGRSRRRSHSAFVRSIVAGEISATPVMPCRIASGRTIFVRDRVADAQRRSCACCGSLPDMAPMSGNALNDGPKAMIAPEDVREQEQRKQAHLTSSMSLDAATQLRP